MVSVVKSVMVTLYTVMGVLPNISIAATLMIRIAMFWFKVYLKRLYFYFSPKKHYKLDDMEFYPGKNV